VTAGPTLLRVEWLRAGRGRPVLLAPLLPIAGPLAILSALSRGRFAPSAVRGILLSFPAGRGTLSLSVSGGGTTMDEERRQVLAMLREGKVTVEEAERLLDALGRPGAPGGAPRFLRVVVTGKDSVNIRVPLALVRSGMRLTQVLPADARDAVGKALAGKGIALDAFGGKTADVEALIAALADLTVDVDDGRDKVRVFCE
jgi:hypothetical protein